MKFTQTTALLFSAILAGADAQSTGGSRTPVTGGSRTPVTQTSGRTPVTQTSGRTPVTTTTEAPPATGGGGGGGPSACAIVGETGNAFADFDEVIHGLPSNTFTSNCNCQALGYDYGWKMEGCFERPTAISFDSMTKTGQPTCNPYGSGSFYLTCSDESEPIDATIKAAVDTAVIMKGGNGGVIYKLSAGEEVTVDVGQRKAISHIEFCFKCEDEIVTNSLRLPAAEEEDDFVCEGNASINHDAAQTIQELTITVDIVNDKSHFDLIVKDAPYAPEGGEIRIPAWCVDYSRGIWGADFVMDVFSAFDPDIISLYGQGHEDTSAVDYPEYLPNLGWLMNNINIGDYYDDGNRCRGTIDWNEFQVALWYIIDGVEIGDRIHSYYNRRRQDCISRGLAALAIEQGNGWVPDCMKPDELVPLLFIVDDAEGDITNQVLMGEVKLSSIEGMCECEPTAAPTPAPTDDVMTTTSPPGTKGDPHFKTHGGELYDFHGGCDMVLLENPSYKNGLGMSIHIRTRIATWWSYVESAVVKIGDDTVEISGNDDEWLWINGVPTGSSIESGQWVHGEIAGNTLRYKESPVKGHSNREAHLYLGHGEKIRMKAYKSFVKVEFVNESEETLSGSLGLLGRFPDGQRVGRDGKTFIEDINEFALQWQVQPDESKLFHSYDDAWVVPAGEKCAMPTESAEQALLRKRRLATGLEIEEAEKACAFLDSEMDRKACIFDVIATQDTGMAAVW